MYHFSPEKENPLYTPKDSVHREIELASRRALRLSMKDRDENELWNEQMLSAMDTQIEMLASFYAFRETAATASSLRTLAQSLRDDALIASYAPDKASVTVPAFSAAFVTAIGEYYENSGDRETAYELLPVMYEILSGFYGRMKHNDWMLPAYRQKEYWNFYEWAPGLSGEIGKEESPEEMSYDAPLFALVAMAFESYANLMMKLGTVDKNPRLYEEGDAALHCRDELLERLNEYFLDRESGLYCTRLGVSLSDGSPIVPDAPHYAELTQALCVLAGAVSDDRLDALLDRIYKSDGLVPSTRATGIFRYEALMKKPEIYAPLVKKELELRLGSISNAESPVFYKTEGSDAQRALCHDRLVFPIILYGKYREFFFGESPKTDISTKEAVL